MLTFGIEHLLLLRLPGLDADLADGEPRPLGVLAPRVEGLHAVPHVGPHGTALPVEFQHHQLADVHVQGDEEGVGLIARDLLNAETHTHKGQRFLLYY